MNLNKMFVFIFVFFLVFAVLLVTMPTQFILLGIDADVQDKEAASFFNAQNVTMYNYTYTIDPLEYGVYNQSDFGLPAGQMIEFQFSWRLAILHLTDNFLGWWVGWHLLLLSEPYATTAASTNGRLSLDQLLLLWDEEANASYYECGCSHINLKVFVMTANDSWTLTESWNNGELKLYTSYMIDWTATGTSMWHIMMRLLSFQNPDLGIPGIGGQILTVGFGGALWASIAILVYALITAVIPFVSGWGGGGG